MHNMEIYSLHVLSEVKGHPVNCFAALHLSFAVCEGKRFLGPGGIFLAAVP